MEFRITMRGTEGLLMHSAALANPLDPAARAVKKLTGKMKKTEDDYLELAHVEWTGGMYFDDVAGPYVPGDNIWRCLNDGARKSKRGVKVKEGVFVTTSINPLGYKGPRDLDSLWADENFRHMASAKVGMQRVTRTRPLFRDWTVQADGILDTAVLELHELKAIAETAGQLVGLGDWRPRFGRFEAEVTAL